MLPKGVIVKMKQPPHINNFIIKKIICETTEFALLFWIFLNNSLNVY